MNAEIDAARMKQLRLMILSNMNRMYPTPLQVRTLFRVMVSFDEGYSLSLMEKDVTYLRQKGYVQFIDETLGGGLSFERKVLGLTAAGKEIADKTQTDEALEI